jgi:hypothetical protein
VCDAPVAVNHPTALNGPSCKLHGLVQITDSIASERIIQRAVSHLHVAFSWTCGSVAAIDFNLDLQSNIHMGFRLAVAGAHFSPAADTSHPLCMGICITIG